MPSVLSDLLGGRGSTGRFDVLEIRKVETGQSAIVVCLSIGPGYSSDHKADEWSARRRALNYRYIDGELVPSGIEASIILYDGNWSGKSLTKLRRAGWTNVENVTTMENALREIFALGES